MALSNDDVAQAVLDRFGGKLDESESSAVAGPFRVGKFSLWQIWTLKGGFYHAHHAVSSDQRNIETFQDFAPFANWLGQVVNDHSIVKTRLLVAVLIVIVALGILVYVVARNDEVVDAAYLMTALVGGAVAYLLGDWVRTK